jgi:hypothetical protein
MRFPFVVVVQTIEAWQLLQVDNFTVHLPWRWRTVADYLSAGT